ncbi:MAG: hypothetical protein ACLVJH_06890 [Faecalibacterium prausnitzii]
MDWNDWFTAEDMAAYVPGFVQDGIIDGRQVVFPVSKSTSSSFERLPVRPVCGGHRGAAFHPCHMGRLFEMAGAYRQWSQGKPFCALDYPCVWWS